MLFLRPGLAELSYLNGTLPIKISVVILCPSILEAIRCSTYRSTAFSQTMSFCSSVDYVFCSEMRTTRTESFDIRFEGKSVDICFKILGAKSGKGSFFNEFDAPGVVTRFTAHATGRQLRNMDSFRSPICIKESTNNLKNRSWGKASFILVHLSGKLPIRIHLTRHLLQMQKKKVNEETEISAKDGAL